MESTNQELVSIVTSENDNNTNNEESDSDTNEEIYENIANEEGRIPVIKIKKIILKTNKPDEMSTNHFEYLCRLCLTLITQHVESLNSLLEEC